MKMHTVHYYSDSTLVILWACLCDMLDSDEECNMSKPPTQDRPKGIVTIS